MQNPNSENSTTQQNTQLQENVIAILKSDALADFINKLNPNTPRLQIIKTFLYLITIIISVFGFYLAWYSSYQTDKAQAKLAYNEVQAQHIRDRIKEKTYWLNQGIDVITDVRKTRQMIVLSCLHHTPYSKKQQALMRSSALFEVIKTFSKSRSIFQSQELLDTIQAFNEFDGSIADVCAKDSPSDQVWRQYSTKINNLMRDSINMDEKKLAELK